MKKIKIISKIAEIYHHRHHFCNIPYIMKQEKHIIDSITPTFFELKNCVTLHIIYIMYCIMKQKLPIESHPFPPFLPDGARVLMLGTFPPKPNRWAMEFFYPNKTNDMWKIMGHIFYADRFKFYNAEQRTYRLQEIKAFLTEQHIALYDTANRVRRLKDNASDKFLEIVETIDLKAFFATCPTLEAVVTAGEKATGVIASMANVEVPKMGEMVECEYAGYRFKLFRMPSSSRAYPLALEKKAEAYCKMFRQLGYEI